MGISDSSIERMTPAIERLQLSQKQVFTDYQACLEATRPEIVVHCPATAEHGEWVEGSLRSGRISS